MKQVIVGVMGPGEGASDNDMELAYRLGKRIAENGYILVNGGRSAGVMNASARGANEKKGIVVGILPGIDKKGMSEYISIPIITGMGNARNVINILTPDIIVAIGSGSGTFSEISLAVKSGKPLIIAHQTDEFKTVIHELSQNVYFLEDENEMMLKIKNIMNLQ
jgi:uncharacterized protein (TIGR00725 family)